MAAILAMEQPQLDAFNCPLAAASPSNTPSNRPLGLLRPSAQESQATPAIVRPTPRLSGYGTASRFAAPAPRVLEAAEFNRSETAKQIRASFESLVRASPSPQALVTATNAGPFTGGIWQPGSVPKPEPARPAQKSRPAEDPVLAKLLKRSSLSSPTVPLPHGMLTGSSKLTPPRVQQMASEDAAPAELPVSQAAILPASKETKPGSQSWLGAFPAFRVQPQASRPVQQKPIDSDETDLSDDDREAEVNMCATRQASGTASGQANQQQQDWSTVPTAGAAATPADVMPASRQSLAATVKQVNDDMNQANAHIETSPSTLSDAEPGGADAPNDRDVEQSCRAALHSPPSSSRQQQASMQAGRSPKISVSELVGKGCSGSLNARAKAASTVSELGMLGAEAILQDLAAQQDSSCEKADRDPATHSGAQSEQEMPTAGPKISNGDIDIGGMESGLLPEATPKEFIEGQADQPAVGSQEAPSAAIKTRDASDSQSPSEAPAEPAAELLDIREQGQEVKEETTEPLLCSSAPQGAARVPPEEQLNSEPDACQQSTPASLGTAPSSRKDCSGGLRNLAGSKKTLTAQKRKAAVATPIGVGWTVKRPRSISRQAKTGETDSGGQAADGEQPSGDEAAASRRSGRLSGAPAGPGLGEESLLDILARAGAVVGSGAEAPRSSGKLFQAKATNRGGEEAPLLSEKVQQSRRALAQPRKATGSAAADKIKESEAAQIQQVPDGEPAGTTGLQQAVAPEASGAPADSTLQQIASPAKAQKPASTNKRAADKSLLAAQGGMKKKLAARSAAVKSPPRVPQQKQIPVQVSRTGRVRAPPVAFWANQRLQIDPKSGKYLVKNEFEDQLTFEKPLRSDRQPTSPLPRVKSRPTMKQQVSGDKETKPARRQSSRAKLAPKHPVREGHRVLKEEQDSLPSSDRAPTPVSVSADAMAAGRAAAERVDPGPGGAATRSGEAHAQAIRNQPGNILPASEAEASSGQDIICRIRLNPGKKRAYVIQDSSHSAQTVSNSHKRSKPATNRKSTLQQASKAEETGGKRTHAEDTGCSPPANKLQRKNNEVDAKAKKRGENPKADTNRSCTGVYPRCAVCRRKRRSHSYCGTDTAPWDCMNRAAAGLPTQRPANGKVKGMEGQCKQPPASKAVTTHAAEQDQKCKENQRLGNAEKRNAGSSRFHSRQRAPNPKRDIAAADKGKSVEEADLVNGDPAAGHADSQGSADANEQAREQICSREEEGKEEEDADEGWTKKQLAALQSAWLRGVEPTAPGFWQRVAKLVPGNKTALECHSKYMSQFGATPAPKPSRPRSKAALANGNASKPTGLHGKKPTRFAVRKMAREARLQQRVADAQPDDNLLDSPAAAVPAAMSLEETKERQERADRYIDALLRRRGSKGPWVIGTGVGKGEIQHQAQHATGVAGGSGRNLGGLVDQLTNLAADKRPGLESDDEEKDDYFSDASEE